MRKLLIPLLFLLPVSLLLPNCGGSSSNGPKTSGISYRAFVSNFVGSGTAAAGVYIVDAQFDTYRRGLAPISAGNTPGMMAVTPNRALTLVYSGNNLPSSDNQFSIINNTTENNASHLTLPGYTVSFVISPDSSTAYVAVPTANVKGPFQGAIEIVALSTGAVTGEIDIPSVQYLSMSNGGSEFLAFSQNSDSVAVVTPSNLGTNFPVVTYVGGFDQPVQAYFSSDDTTAYVVNCGAECGGVQASVQPLNLTTNIAGAAVPVPASTVSLVIGSTMYLAGTPYSGGVPSQPCTGEITAATTCGLLTIFDLSTMSIANAAPIVITDGYHTRIAMGANGQLFIGSRTCTEIIPPQPPPPGAEVRGCLSIYNTLTTAVGTVPGGTVLIPPANGDVTGLQPIGERLVVYVVQGGSLTIYDDTIDALYYNPNDPNNPGQIFGLVGDFMDVKTVD